MIPPPPPPRSEIWKSNLVRRSAVQKRVTPPAHSFFIGPIVINIHTYISHYRVVQIRRVLTKGSPSFHPPPETASTRNRRRPFIQGPGIRTLNQTTVKITPPDLRERLSCLESVLILALETSMLKLTGHAPLSLGVISPARWLGPAKRIFKGGRVLRFLCPHFVCTLGLAHHLPFCLL